MMLLLSTRYLHRHPDPITDSGQTLIVSEQNQHVEDAGGCGAAGKRSAKRLGNLAQPDSRCFGYSPYGALDRGGSPVRQRRNRLMNVRKQCQTAIV
jgi:hypothetical protein